MGKHLPLCWLIFHQGVISSDRKLKGSEHVERLGGNGESLRWSADGTAAAPALAQLRF